ncbi:MAG: serine/threonine protein kinase [Armatimonadetes bacterium]|nr:serine/threonine protein kinase [Armatimonadota bacterium]
MLVLLLSLLIPVRAEERPLTVTVTSDRPGELFVRRVDAVEGGFRSAGSIGRGPVVLQVAPNERLDLEVRGRLDLFRVYRGSKPDISGGMRPEIRTDVELDWPRVAGVPLLAVALIALGLYRRSRSLEQERQVAHLLATEAISRARRAEARSGDPLRIGRYQVLGRLGEGGMGRVYLVEDDYGDRFALKVPERSSLRFQREWDILRSFSHPGVVRLFDFDPGTEEDPPYLVMELLEGTTLGQRLERGRLPIPEARRVARQLLEVLDYAHSRGVIHRDLSPANVFLMPDGSVKVVDFGISKSFDMRGLTRTGEILGTPAYAAPEQVESLQVDARADLYSVGVLLHEMLTGRLPWEARDPVQLFLKKTRERPRPPHELQPDIPEDLSRLVMDLLEIAPADRIASAAQALERLG